MPELDFMVTADYVRAEGGMLHMIAARAGTLLVPAVPAARPPGAGLRLQTARLRDYGCTTVYTDHGVSGAKASRPQWDRCLDHLREGDTLVAVRLDRLGRSLKNLIEAVQQLAERGADGLAAARERHGGKLPVCGPSIDSGKLQVARELPVRGDLPAKRIAEIVGISRASLYRALPPGGKQSDSPAVAP